MYAPSFHPAAGIFPLMEGAEFDELVESIRAHGLRESIKTLDGQIIDGRNRMTACKLAGVKPRFEPADVNGSVADYVYDMNYHRRHLTSGGKAAAAARYKEVAAEEAAERMKAGKKNPVATAPQGKARDIAGEKYGVSGKTVDAAEKVIKKGAPEVVKAMERGELPVATAAKLADAPKAVQKAAVKAGKRAISKAIEGVQRAKKDEPAKLPRRKPLTQADEKRASQADARRYWLRQLVDFVEWIERFVADQSNAELKWYTEPDSPGLFDHGLTPRRLTAAIEQLDRVRTQTLGGSRHGKTK